MYEPQESKKVQYGHRKIFPSANLLHADKELD